MATSPVTLTTENATADRYALFNRTDTPLTWTLPASMVDTGSTIVTGEMGENYPAHVLDNAYNEVAWAIRRETPFSWSNVPPEGNALRSFFMADNPARDFRNAVQKITPTKFAKVVANYFFKTYQFRVPENTKNSIASETARFMQSISSRIVDYTTAFTWDRGDFGDNGSCYWNQSQYNHSRINTLPKLGALAIREFDKRGEGSGRAWVIPIPKMHFADAPVFQVMNAYGSFKDLPPHPADILARHLTLNTGIVFTVYENYWVHIAETYQNGDNRIVAPAGLTLPRNWATGDYRTNVYFGEVGLPRPKWAIEDRHSVKRCDECNEVLALHLFDNDSDTCRDCEEDEDKEDCSECGERFHVDDLTSIDDWRHTHYCESCLANVAVYSDRLERYVLRSEAIEIEDEVYEHDEYDDTWEVCDITRVAYPADQMVDVVDDTETVFRVHTSIADLYCKQFDDYADPIFVKAVELADLPSDVRNALNWSECDRFARMIPPRALHWLELPVEYTADVPDTLTIPLFDAAVLFDAAAVVNGEMPW